MSNPPRRLGGKAKIELPDKTKSEDVEILEDDQDKNDEDLGDSPSAKKSKAEGEEVARE